MNVSNVMHVSACAIALAGLMATAWPVPEALGRISDRDSSPPAAPQQRLAPAPWDDLSALSGVELEAAETAQRRTPARRVSNAVGCLALAIYFEARGEPPAGQILVGRVILNRVKSDAHPDTVCQVVYKNAHRPNACQFSFACDGRPETIREYQAWDRALARARELLTCTFGCDSASANDLWRSTHYHANYVSPYWSDAMARTGQIGQHIFYDETRPPEPKPSLEVVEVLNALARPTGPQA